MKKAHQPFNKRERINRRVMVVELFLTIGICITIIFAGVFDLEKMAESTAKEVDSDYQVLMDGYVTTFKNLTLMIEEKIEQDYSFDEMLTWLQSMEEKFCANVGEEVYDGIALTYKGGYARSWSYGDYEDYDATTRPWYQRAQEADGKVVVVAPYVTYLDPSYFEDDEYILMSIAWKYNDEISFDYDIKIKEIENLLTSRNYPYENTRVLLYDKNGYILSSSNDSEFAHNVNTADDVISLEFSRTVLENQKDGNGLKLKRIDNQWEFIYSQRDSNGNTFCMMFPLWEVFHHDFLYVILITLLLVLMEVYIYFNNVKSIQGFWRRDQRLSAISDAAFEEQVYVDIDRMDFSGSDLIQELLKTTDYEAAYHSMLYLAADEESRHKIETFLAPAVIRAETDYDGTIITHRIAIKSIRSNKNGKVRVYEVNRMFSILDRKRIMSLLCNDVTESARQLKEALQDAQAANRAKTDFLSRMSHDIRTPMNAIIGMTHLAKDEDDIHVIREYLDNIDSSSEFLLGLINDILDLSKIESGELELHPEPYAVEEFMRSVNTVIRPLMEAKHITFVFEMNCGASCILVDKLRFSQIFFNLLSNAAKFTPEGGKVEFLAEHIPPKDGAYGARYRVRDNGIGMSEEFLPHIFEAFSQEKTDPNCDAGGTGLGLPIVKSLVDAMGGSIQVHSKLGEGTEYIIDLYAPLAEEMQESEETSVHEKCQEGKRILLVEDNDMNIMVACRLLEKKKYLVTVARDGKQAVEAFEKSPTGFFDAILMDVRMPVLNGLQATKAIRSCQREDARTVPIIAMTADAFEEEQKRTIEAGMNYHLSKPINPDELYGVLQRYI